VVVVATMRFSLLVMTYNFWETSESRRVNRDLMFYVFEIRSHLVAAVCLQSMRYVDSNAK